MTIDELKVDINLGYFPDHAELLLKLIAVVDAAKDECRHQKGLLQLEEALKSLNGKSV